jgi:hypothetical protein
MKSLQISFTGRTRAITVADQPTFAKIANITIRLLTIIAGNPAQKEWWKKNLPIFAIFSKPLLEGLGLDPSLQTT